jgi:hypothetical protein
VGHAVSARRELAGQHRLRGGVANGGRNTLVIGGDHDPVDALDGSAALNYVMNERAVEKSRQWLARQPG